MKLPGPWSYSSAKLYDQCAKKYYHLKVAKTYQEDQNAVHLIYGKSFHEAAEFYVRDGTPLPAEFRFAKQYLDMLVAIPGTKHCEYEMGLKEDLTPCGFHDPDAWYRGIADLIVVSEDGTKARVLDYKSSKSSKYADVGQLELMSLCIFKHFPTVRSVKAGLLFVVCNDFKPAAYKYEEQPVYWRNWMPLISRIERSFETGVWNPRPSGLCARHCVVLECPHNGANR